MDTVVINNLLKEYEQKRINNDLELEVRKNSIYSVCPRLKEIENELNTISIQTAKSILFSKDVSALDKLEKNIEKLTLEKKELLKKLDKDENYLSLNYDCSICKDTGYIASSFGSDTCNCLKQKLFNITYNSSNINNLEKENFDNFNLDYYSNTPDLRKYGSTTSPKENMDLIKALCVKFVDNFDDPDERNLLFVGNSGTGKTFLSNCIAKELLDTGKTVLYQTAPVLFDTIINYRFNKNTGAVNIYDNILNVDLLIIDDLGTETTNSMIFSELFNIINSRILNQNNKITKTIISTNLSLQNLLGKYDERITSRLIGNYTTVKFFGEDIRLLKKGIKL